MQRDHIGEYVVELHFEYEPEDLHVKEYYDECPRNYGGKPWACVELT
jgi:hypothetical protein